MYEVSNQFKAYCKRHIRTFKSATITYYEGNEQQTIESEDILKFDISAEPYIDYQIIGQAVAKKIHISIRGSYDLANKEINVTTTMIYDDNTEEVLNLGNYIIASDYDSSVKNQCSFTGYDYMIKMDDKYSDEGLTYPCTIQDVIENICEQKDIELATTDLPNGDLEVIGNNFQDGATYRDVIKQIAQVNGTFAYIDRENKLHIDTLMNHETLQGEGSSITLSGTTAYGNIIDYILEGNTTQNGTPTPSSPVPVNNVTGLQKVRVCGKNLIDMTPNKWQNGTWSTSSGGEKIKIVASNSRVSLKEIVRVEPSATYYVSINTNKNILFRCLDINGDYITSNINMQRQTWVAPNNCYYVCVTLYDNLQIQEIENGNIKVQLEKAIKQSEYQKYQGKDYIVDLGGKNIGKIPTWTSDTKNGITATFNPETQIFTFNGTCTSDNTTFWLLIGGYTFNCIANITTLSAHYVGGNVSGHATIQFQSQDYKNSLSVSVVTLSDTNKAVSSIASADFISTSNTIRFDNGSVADNLQFKIMVANSTDTTYSPYTETPIELNKIGDYQDFIRKGTGKNLFDKNTVTTGYRLDNNIGDITEQSGSFCSNYIKISQNTTYTKNSPTADAYHRVCFYSSQSVSGFISRSESNTFTTPSNCKYLRFCGYETELDKTMLEKAPSATPFEPYGYKDKWYIEKNVGKVVLDGTENWTTRTASTGAQLYETSVSGFYSTQSITMGYSNQYIANISLINDNTFRILKGITLALHNDTIGSLSNLKTFLANNNLIIYYPLATPTFTLIADEELIEQLNALNNGYVYGTNSNISVSGNIPSIINISVDAPGRDVEDEVTPSSYLTDFKQSREYGPVNRVQITMTDIEDATYIENAESITKDGIQTITINDNYFLSSEELKAKAIRPLWNSLYTIKYMPISCKYLGLPYIEMNDYIGITLPNGDVTGTYVFNYKFTYDGGYMGELETPTISRTQETYPTESINSQVQKMGINVDRANARITSEIIARQETDENVTRIEQSIDEINLSVSTTQTDLTNLEGQVQTNTASIGVNADNISLAVEKNTQTQDQLDTLQTNTENVVNQLVFNGDGLTISALGSTSDDMKLNLTNDAINFMYNNNVILKINGSTIEFANASFQKLDLGNYVWVAEEDDSLSLIYEGE